MNIKSSTTTTTTFFLALIMAAMLLPFHAQAQNGYIYVHEKFLDEASASDIAFSGTGSIGGFSLNDNPTQTPTIDLGCSQSGRLWAISSSNVLYYRDINSTKWVQTTVNNALHVAGGPNDTCYIVTTGNNVQIYDHNGNLTTLVSSPSANIGNTGALNISSGWNRKPYIVNGSGKLYQYSGSGTGAWALTSSGTFSTSAVLDANPVNGNALVLGGDGNIYNVPSGTSSSTSPTSISNPGGGITDVAVDGSGNIYAVVGTYVSLYSGTAWGTPDPTSRGGYTATAGAGNEVWEGSIGGTSSPYGNIFARAVDSLGNTTWIDDERLRTSPTNQNSVLLAVAPGTYTITETVPTGDYLQQILFYDPLKQTTANFANHSVTITVTANHTVDVIFQTGLIQTFQMTTDCNVAYQENFGTGSVGSFGAALTGQTPYHYINTAVNCNDGYYKVVTQAFDWANFLNNTTLEPNFYDHTTGNGTGQMMAVNASYDKNEFFRRRFEGLIVGETYKFSAWLASFDSVTIFPNVNFEVLDTATQNIIDSISSGQIVNPGKWFQYTLAFVATEQSFDLVLRNNNIGGNGNDLALDDITFTLAPAAKPVNTVVGLGCGTSGSITITSPVGSSYEYKLNSGAYQSSPTFSNLPAGIDTVIANYTVTINCVSDTAYDTVRTSVCGNIYNESASAALTGISGTGTNAGGVNIVMWDETQKKVVGIAPVASNGSYSIGGAFTSGGNPGDSLVVYLTSASVTVGQTSVPTLSLPTGWAYTGEALGTGPSTGILGYLSLGAVSTNIPNANFAIYCSATVNSVKVQTLCSLTTNAVVNATATGTGTWTAKAGNPGTASIVAGTSNNYTFTNFSAIGAYVFYWSNGCSTDSVSISVYAAPSVSITSTGSNLCIGGSVTLTAAGAAGGSPSSGSYAWSPTTNLAPNGSVAQVTVTPLSPASQAYTVTFTASTGGCTATASNTVTSYTTPTISNTGGGIDSQKYCYPASTASITETLGGSLSVSGGSGSYSYSWSPSGNLTNPNTLTPTVTITSPGAVVATTKYKVTVTDLSTNCSAVDSVVLVVYPTASVSINPTTSNLCVGGSVPLSATGSPSGGTYSWSPTVGLAPSGTVATVTASPSGNETYTVAYSLNGCSSVSATTTVNVYPDVSASASATGSPLTYCLPVAGKIRLGANPTAIGGSGFFTYAWSNAASLTNPTLDTPYITRPVYTTTTTYTVTVTDTKSLCTATSSVVVVIDSPTLSISPSTPINICAGNSQTLTATGTPSSGSYQWATLPNLTTVGNASTLTVSPPAGSQGYQATYTAPSGCTVTASKTVNVGSTITAGAGGAQNFCYVPGLIITLPGSASGGSGNYTYHWSPGPGSPSLSSTSAVSPTVSNPSSGITFTDTLLVTDNVSGCTATSIAVITIYPAVTVNTGGTASACAGSAKQIGGSPATGSGGTGALSYNWSGYGLNSNTVSNPIATPGSSSSYTYTVTVTDTKSCSATGSLTLNVNPAVTAYAGTAQNVPNCSTVPVPIGGSPTGTGGTGALTYSWTATAGTLSSSDTSNPTVTHLGGNGTYTVTVTDTKGCSATSSVQLTVTTATLQVSAGTGGAYCAGSGGSVALTGSVTGGTSPYTYLWSPTTGLSDTFQKTTTASPTGVGIYKYSFKVTDASGCAASDTVIVTVRPYVIANAGKAVDSVCAGSGVTIGGSGANPTGSGGTGSLTYSWSATSGLSAYNVANPIASPAVSTPYTVTVTDSTHCSASSSTNVTVVPIPAAHAGGPQQNYCYSGTGTGTFTLGASTAATGGSGNYSYAWYPKTTHNTALVDSTQANPTVDISGDTSIKFYLRVTDNVTGCTSTDSVVLNVLAQPSVAIPSSVTANICTGGSCGVLFATGSPSGGSYQWSPTANMTPSLGGADTVTVCPASNQTYQVVYTQGGCSATASQKVTVYTAVVANALPNESFCAPVSSTITLGGGSTATQGSGQYNYSWSPVTNLNGANTANPTIKSNNFTGDSTFTLIVTDAVTKCTSVSSMTVTINPKDTVTIAQTDTNLCEGGSTLLVATGKPGGGTYQWNPTFNMSPGLGNKDSVTVAPSAAVNTYQVTYTGAGGCTADTSITVHVYTTVTANAGISQSYCLPYAGAISLGGSPTASGGSGKYAYVWSPNRNITTNSIANPVVAHVDTNAEYYLTVTDTVTKCYAKDSVHLTLNSKPTVSVLSIPPADTNIYFGNSIVLYAKDTPAGGTYQWTPIVYLDPGTGNTDSVTVSPVNTQLYQVVYFLNGCSDTAYQTVHVYPLITANAGGNQKICLPYNGTVTLGLAGGHTASGGSGSYSYAWSPNINLNSDTLANPSLDSVVVTHQKYTVVVTDKVSGYTATDTMDLNIYPKITLSIAASRDTTCIGDSVHLNASATLAGGNFQWNPIIAMTPANGNDSDVIVAPSGAGSQTYFVYYNIAGCLDTNSVVVTALSAPVANAGPNQSYCLPVTTTITLGGTTNGGSGHYTYSWSSASNLAANESTTFDPTVTADTVAGVYIYTDTVTDVSTGCRSTSSMDLILNTRPVDTITASDTNLCQGGVATLTAKGTPSGGSYQWAVIGNISPYPGNTATVTASPTGVGTEVYQVVYQTTTFGFGCYDTAYQALHVYNTVVAHAGGSKSYCPPINTVTLGAIPAATGGSGAFKYAWSVQGSPAVISTSANPTVTPTGTATYYLTVTDTVTGCSSVDSSVVTRNPTPSARTARAVGICVGGSAVLSASGGVSYIWSDPGNSLSNAYASSPTASPTDSVIYSVTVTDINGCTASANDTVNVGSTLTFSVPTVTVCQGDTGTLRPSLNGSNYTYQWSPGNLNCLTCDSPKVFPTSEFSIYTLTITDTYTHCTGTDTAAVIMHPNPNAGFFAPTVCAGATVAFTDQSTSSDPIASWYYNFGDVGQTADTSHLQNPTYVYVTSSAHSAFQRVTTIYGCSDSVYNTINSNPPVIPGVNPPDTIAIGASAVLGASGGVTYAWSPAATLLHPNTNNPTASPDTTTKYTVTITNSTGCTAVDSEYVVVLPLPNVSAGGNRSVCLGDTITLLGSSTTAGVTFSWSPAFYLSNPDTSKPRVSPPSAGQYKYILTVTQIVNSFPVSNSDTMILTVNPSPTASAGPGVTIVSCSGVNDSVQIGGSPTASGGTPGYTYKWATSQGNTTGLTSTNVAYPYVKNLGSPTTYDVTVTDNLGCTATASMTVTTSPAAISVSITPSGDTSWCAGTGGYVTLTVNASGGTPLYSYLWTSSAAGANLSSTSSQVVTASPSATGSYPISVQVTDHNLCQANSNAQIILVKPEPHPVINGVPDSVCAGVGSIPLNVGNPGIVWQQGSGVVGNTFRPSSVGPGVYTLNYSLTSGGCTNDTFQTITVDSVPVVTITGKTAYTYCSSGATALFSGTPAGGTFSGPGINATTGVFSPDSVSITNGLSASVILTYHYTSPLGCTDSASVSVTVNQSPSDSISASADTICQGQSILLTPNYAALPLIQNIRWYNLNGTLITNSLNPVQVSPVGFNAGYYTVITSTQACSTNDTIYIHVNQSPTSGPIHDSTCEGTPLTVNVLDSVHDVEGNAEVVTVLRDPHGSSVVSAGEIVYNSSYGYHGLDTVEYSVCNAQCLHDCDTGYVYMYVCPRNLPPTADTIRYTQVDSIPQDINVGLTTSDPNGDSLKITMVGDSTDGGHVTVVNTGNGAYTITGDSIGTYVISYRVCDTDRYLIHVLCDTSVIVAHIIPNVPADTLNQPPVANNDYATTSGLTAATVNVRGNDYSNPTSDGLGTPSLLGNTAPADGRWSVNAGGQVVFQPASGLAPGIHYDTIHYQVCDPVDNKCATALVVVTTNEIDNPANRPPLAVNDHETVPENTTSSFNVKNNDSDPDGDSLTIPAITSLPVNGTIVSVADNGTITYKPRFGVQSLNGAPVDSFRYSVCDTLAAAPVSPLCASAEVYVYVTPANLPPNAAAIVYTQFDSVPQDVNVLSATSSPNGTPLTVSIVNNPYPDSINIVKTGNGAYTITGNDTGTYTITYQVCDQNQYPVYVLCDTNVIIAHIIPTNVPGDTLNKPPYAAPDLATTSGTTPAVVNVRANDYSDPTGHGLTIPTLVGGPADTTADGTWTVDANGNVVFQPKAGLAVGIYTDTVHYQVCDLVNHLCADTFVVVTTDESGAPIANRPPVAVNQHEYIPENTSQCFNIKLHDSDPDGNPIDSPTIVTQPIHGSITSVAANGTTCYTPNSNIHSLNNQPIDSFRYAICDTNVANAIHSLCDTAEVYIYVTPRNLPPNAAAIVYTQFDSVPQDVNVLSATSSPNGTPLTVSIVNNPYPDSINIVKTGNGAYTITGNDTGTYTITYQVCDQNQYPVYVLCDTNVIIAHIIPTNVPGDTVNKPPYAAPDLATTSGTTPAVVNVRANDYSDPTGHGLTIPTLVGGPADTTADGTWTVDANGNVVFQPKAGLAVGIYTDTVRYQVCDLVDVPQLCADTFVVVTTDEEDTPIANRPPVAVDDHVTVPENSGGCFNIKANDSDPDGNPIDSPTIVTGTGPAHGVITGVAANGIVCYTPNPNVQSINGQPVDSFKYAICDNNVANAIHSLCDSAEVYIYVAPRNLPPTADTIVYTQLVTVPQDVNVSLSTSDPNADPLTITIASNPNPGAISVTGSTNGAYTVTGNTIGTYVISYSVCDTDKYLIHVLCDTSVIIAHIVSPADTLDQPPVANNDFATTSGTAPATVNVRGNDYSDPTSDSLTIPVLTSRDTTADGSWSVNGLGDVVFQPRSGLGDAIYYDTVRYRVCDRVDQLCDSAYVVVTTNENVDQPITNRPPVAVNDHETVQEDTVGVFNVKNNDSDPDGDSLTIPTIVTGPSNGTVVSVADNGTVTYRPNRNIAGGSTYPVDSFRYSICDTLSAHTPRPRCDSAEVYIYIGNTLFAVKDSSGTGCTSASPVTICVKCNDYDIEGQSFFVKAVVTQPAHGTAVVNGLQDSVTYTPNGYAAQFPNGIIDSFRYVDQDALGATDTAWVYVTVKCCAVHAASHFYSDSYLDTLYAAVLVGDVYDTLVHTISLLPGSGPSNGTAVVIGDSIRYAPRKSFCGLDTFRYILADQCGKDTGLVQINVLCDSNCIKPVAINDTSYHGYVCNDTVKVLVNDIGVQAGDSLTVIQAPLYGTTTVVRDSEVVYIPDGTHPNVTDILKYSVCNEPCGLCDTATVFIHMSQYPCNYFSPIVHNDTVDLCRNRDTLINVLAKDTDINGGETIFIKSVASADHGTAVNQGDSVINYHPNANYVGTDTFTYQVCNTGVPNLCSLAKVIINVNACLPAPIVVDTLIRDTTTACAAKTFCIDSIYQAGVFLVHFTGQCDSAQHGTVVLSTDTVRADSTGQLCFTYTASCDTSGGAKPYTGNDTLCLIICDTGVNGICTNVHVIITILPKPPIDTIWAHQDVAYTCNAPVTVNVLANDGFLPDPGTSQTGTAIHVTAAGAAAGSAPRHGTVTVASDSTVIYVPNTNYAGIDTFAYTISNNGTPPLFASSIVIMYVCVPPKPIAVNDCSDTTTYVNQPGIINVFANDTLVPADDTSLTIIVLPDSGVATVNANYTITYVPNTSFHGSDSLVYVVCETAGPVTGCDTAKVCIDVVDSVPDCFFPNGFSPNGDGVNDVFVFDCNNQYPNSSLQVFNRWGDEVWKSYGGYKNNWNGTNNSGQEVPDGTYYFVFKYNDGSGRSQARFVVINR